MDKYILSVCRSKFTVAWFPQGLRWSLFTAYHSLFQHLWSLGSYLPLGKIFQLGEVFSPAAELLIWPISILIPLVWQKCTVFLWWEKKWLFSCWFFPGRKATAGVMRPAFWRFVVSVHPPTRPWENAVNVVIPAQQCLCWRVKCHQKRQILNFLTRIKLQENILFIEVQKCWWVGVFNSAAFIINKPV